MCQQLRRGIHAHWVCFCFAGVSPGHVVSHLTVEAWYELAGRSQPLSLRHLPERVLVLSEDVGVPVSGCAIVAVSRRAQAQMNWRLSVEKSQYQTNAGSVWP